MDTLSIFLKALEETFTNKRGVYVQKKLSTPQKFPAYKKVILEVWCVDGEYKTLVSSVETTKRVTTVEEQQELDNFLSLESIKNILRYYGIQ